MKILLNSIFLLILSVSCFSQNSEKEPLNLTFYNECNGEKFVPEFEVFTMPELNYKYITVYRESGDWISQYTTTIKTNNDTIYVPKLLFAGGNELHSRRWTYLNCDKVCDGKESSFFANGNKRIEGEFENGKPTLINYYRKDGTLESKELYKTGEFQAYRTNVYDENEERSEYRIRQKYRKKFVIKTYDKNDNLISKDVEKFWRE